jgi:hypothetical protein
MIRSILALGGSSLLVAIALGACSKSAESVCENLCAKFQECGSTCSCDSSRYESCPNRDAILDHLDGCAQKACSELNDCVFQTPSCDGSSGPGPTVSSTTSSTGGNGGNGGVGAVGGTGPVGGSGGAGDACAELAAICASCSDPNEQAACAATAGTGDPNACQALLDDLPPSCS